MSALNEKKVFLLCFLFLPSLLLAEPVRTLSKKLKSGMDKRKELNLAVLNFTYPRGRMSTGSFLVSERLVTYFVQSGEAVIERRLIEKILEEKRLCETGIVHPGSIKEIGAVLGVDAVVLGTMADLSDKAAEVCARVIHVETGEILSAGSVVMERLWRDRPRIPKLAHMRSPVPVSRSGMAAEWKRPPLRRQPEVLGKKIKGEKPPRYRPAPVPAFNYSPSSRYRLGDAL